MLPAMKDIVEKISSNSLFDCLLLDCLLLRVICSVLGQRCGIIALPNADVIGSVAAPWFRKRVVA